jgi:hypothetical protein
MARVARPGGRILAFDFDWGTLIIDHPDKETTRTIIRTYSDSIRNGWIGRQLPRLFKEQQLEVRSIDSLQVFPHFELCELFLGSHLVALQRTEHSLPSRRGDGGITNSAQTSTGRCWSASRPSSSFASSVDPLMQ